jgi:hypothetical protein
MQSYDGVIRLFPNLRTDGSFKDLRAAGAFLVSASQVKGRVNKVQILSEKGNELRVMIPWNKGAVVNGKRITTKMLRLKTAPGEVVTLSENI